MRLPCLLLFMLIGIFALSTGAIAGDACQPAACEPAMNTLAPVDTCCAAQGVCLRRAYLPRAHVQPGQPVRNAARILPGAVVNVGVGVARGVRRILPPYPRARLLRRCRF
jgi:hypothetical protein